MPSKRTNDVFMQGFDDMTMLLRYLYMKEGNSITVKNAFNVNIILTMDHNGNVFSKNTAFGTRLCFNENVIVENCMDIAEQLKTQPPVAKNTAFKSRYDKIKFEVSSATAITNACKRNQKGA